MNKNIMLTLLFSVLLLGCASLHDNQGWEHTGDSETHQDSTPYIFKHEH